MNMTFDLALESHISSIRMNLFIYFHFEKCQFYSKA